MLDREKLFKTSRTAGMVAAILIGLTLLASGTGKLFGGIETPAQVMHFINDMMPEAMLTPSFIFFVQRVLVPWIFPIAELLIGISLLIGFVPRLAALLSLPMTAVFAATNIWAIVTGSSSTCASCFGLWENIFGHLSPAQSLTIDIILMLLALLVVFLHPGGFLCSRAPSIWINSGLNTLIRQLRDIFTWREAYSGSKGGVLALSGYIVGIAGIVLVVLVLTGVIRPEADSSAKPVLQFRITDNITARDIGYNRAYIEFSTAEPEKVDIIAYDRHGVITGTWSENITSVRHRILLDNLREATTYYVQVLYDDRQNGKGITRQYSFTTMEKPPVIINPYIKEFTNDSVTLVWETERETTAEVDFWRKEDKLFRSVSLPEKALQHSVKLEGLVEKSSYMFKIKARDVFGHMLEAEYEGSFSTDTRPEVTWRAPYFELKSFDDETINLNQFKGKYVLLVFWDMYCPACQQKMPIMQDVYSRLGNKDIVFLAIHGPGREQAIKNYIILEGLRFPVLFDAQGKVNNAYNIRGVPATFLLDRSGIVVSNNLQFESVAALEKAIEYYLR